MEERQRAREGKRERERERKRERRGPAQWPVVSVGLCDPVGAAARAVAGVCSTVLITVLLLASMHVHLPRSLAALYYIKYNEDLHHAKLTTQTAQAARHEPRKHPTLPIQDVIHGTVMLNMASKHCGAAARWQ